MAADAASRSTLAATLSPELAALIGVAIGALLNGGLQTLQRERERRVQARVAARLFVGDLARAEHDVKRIIDARRWPDVNMPSYSREVEVWEARRHEFAAVTNVTQWTLVAVAFQDLVDLPAISRSGDELTPVERRTLEEVRQRVDDAYEIALHWAAPRWQRRGALRKLSQPRPERIETDLLRRVVQGQRDQKDALRAVAEALRTRSVSGEAETAAEPLGEVTSDDIAKAIEDLPEREKLVVALTFYEKLQPQEIAELLGTSEAAVDVLRQRALGMLREALP